MSTQKTIFFSFLASIILPFTVAAEPQVVTKISPVEAKIAAAQAKVKATPNAASSYIELAAALCRKGRDTEDVAIYEEAEKAINRALQLSKGNYEARRLQVTILLGKHEFAQALTLATELNKKVPDDVAGWASLAEANMALGNYSEAERQAQWVLDLRPGNILGYETSAELRELFGDVPGAIEFWDEANRRTSANDADEHAWLLTQKSRLQLISGYDKEAEDVLQQALQLSPDSQFTLKVLADIREAQGKFEEASQLFERRYERVRSTANLYNWAEALEKSGKKLQAADAFQKFQKQAEGETGKAFNANLQLVFFDLNQKHDPAAALALATKMAADRHDSATLDAYAWALYSNGKYPEAKTQMDRALAVGVRDPWYFCHAAQIAAKIGDATEAASYQKEAASFKFNTCVADAAKILSTPVPTSETLR